jgi:hypothetical protein
VAKSPRPRKTGRVAPQRKTLAETWAYLERRGAEAPRDAAGAAFVPAAKPRPGQRKRGFNYFKAALEEANLSNLTLPRSFFSRSTFEKVRFANTDLSTSWLCSLCRLRGQGSGRPGARRATRRGGRPPVAAGPGGG